MGCSFVRIGKSGEVGWAAAASPGRRPTGWSISCGSGLRLDVPEVRVGVVALLGDIGVRVGGEVALDAVPRVEPGLLDDVLVELRPWPRRPRPPSPVWMVATRSATVSSGWWKALKVAASVRTKFASCHAVGSICSWKNVAAYLAAMMSSIAVVHVELGVVDRDAHVAEVLLDQVEARGAARPGAAACRARSRRGSRRRPAAPWPCRGRTGRPRRARRRSRARSRGRSGR